MRPFPSNDWLHVDEPAVWIDDYTPEETLIRSKKEEHEALLISRAMSLAWTMTQEYDTHVFPPYASG